MRIRPLISGIVSYIPFIYQKFAQGTEGTDSGRYCYSVWLRHLVMNFNFGIKDFPKRVAKLGPGDSLGTGLAALISGADLYYAFDVVKYATSELNLSTFEELVQLFMKRENIPDDQEFPDVLPRLDSYKFPDYILTTDHLTKALQKDRIEFIRHSLINLENSDEPGCIIYVAPWHNDKIIEQSSIDLIFSQAVLEHVDELSSTYQTMYLWLKRGAYMSHTVDFRSHEITDKENGHWAISLPIWKLIRGRKPFLINRLPYSAHIEQLNQHKFKILANIPLQITNGIGRNELAYEFQGFSDNDLSTSRAYFIAMKE